MSVPTKPKGPRRSAIARAIRSIHHLIFHASREGRSAEIAVWSNAIASLGIGAGTFFLTHHSWPLSITTAALSFVLLRLALAHRLTVWIAASCGTLAVSCVGGGLAWLFAHVIEAVPSAPSIAAVIGAVASATLPAWAYGRLAQRRDDHIRDSLIDPVSVPSSRS
jgi:hypothetical protein